MDKIEMEFTLDCGHTRSDMVGPRSSMAVGLVREAPCPNGCGVRWITKTKKV